MSRERGGNQAPLNPTRKGNKMRNYNSVFHVKNALTGVICASTTTAATLQGIAIDTIGFKDMLAVLCVASLKGSSATGQTANLTVKFQESATNGTNWSDITNGCLNGTASVKGSCVFDVVAVSAESRPFATGQYQRKLYLNLNDGVRSRFLRCNASVTGVTAGATGEFVVSVAAILGRPVDSNYIIDAVSLATTVQTEWGFKYGSTPGM